MCDEICKRLKVPLKERAILLEKRYKSEKQLHLIETTKKFTKQDLYWALIGFKPEFVLYMMALAKDEKIKKAISHFYTHQRDLKPFVKGRDLLNLGIQPGPIYTQILHLVLNAKLDGNLKTKKQEINFVKDYAVKNKLIE